MERLVKITKVFVYMYIAGFEGLECAEEIDECRSRPCQNGGICTDRVAEYRCHCQPGYSGKQCEVSEGTAVYIMQYLLWVHCL